MLGGREEFAARGRAERGEKEAAGTDPCRAVRAPDAGAEETRRLCARCHVLPNPPGFLHRGGEGAGRAPGSRARTAPPAPPAEGTPRCPEVAAGFPPGPSDRPDFIWFLSARVGHEEARHHDAAGHGAVLRGVLAHLDAGEGARRGRGRVTRGGPGTASTGRTAGRKTPLGTSGGVAAGLSLPRERPLDLNLEPWCWDGEGIGGSVGDSGTGGGRNMESSTAGNGVWGHLRPQINPITVPDLLSPGECHVPELVPMLAPQNPSLAPPGAPTGARPASGVSKSTPSPTPPNFLLCSSSHSHRPGTFLGPFFIFF